MHYNEKTKELEGNVEMPEKGWADRLMNTIIWGHPQGHESDRNKSNDQI